MKPQRTRGEYRIVMKKWFVLICMLMVSFGCARTRADFAPLSIDSSTSKTGGDILLTTGDLDQPYEELGVIFVKGRCARYKKIVERLRAEAKKIGADAVIKIEFGNHYYRRRPSCRGIAVSFK